MPISDNSMKGEQPTYRDLWLHIRENLPKKGRRAEDVAASPTNLPAELQGAIHSLYENYKRSYAKYEADKKAIESGRTAPVFIVVCNNTNVSKLVYDYISGWEKN